MAMYLGVPLFGVGYGFPLYQAITGTGSEYVTNGAVAEEHFGDDWLLAIPFVGPVLFDLSASRDFEKSRFARETPKKGKSVAILPQFVGAMFILWACWPNPTPQQTTAPLKLRMITPELHGFSGVGLTATFSLQ